jgi:TPP-dependent pyruvate/acetoin dehydrogenase alpha subunit
LYIGEEAVAVGVMQALTEEDNVLCTYREHGHALARGIDADVIMAEMYGKIEGCSLGRGGSMHLFDVSKTLWRQCYRQQSFTAGCRNGFSFQKQKKDNITCCFFGEGAAAEGEFHEAMNLAALWEVPVLFVCENNLYAMGTAIRYSHSVTQIEKKELLTVLKRKRWTEWI